MTQPFSVSTRLDTQESQYLFFRSPFDKAGRVLEDCNKVEELRKCWTNDLQREAKRLEEKGILGKNKVQYVPDLHKLVIIGRALEIKQLFLKTHVSFFHAMSFDHYLLCGLVEKLFKDVHPEVDARLFEFLRVPFQYGDNVKTFLSSTYSFNDTKQDQQRKLLSVDIVPSHDAHFDSIGSLLSFNCGAASTVDKLPNIILDDILSRFFILDKMPIMKHKANEFFDRIIQFYSPLKTKAVLFLLCLPNELIDNPQYRIAYRSHAFGIPCKCEGKASDDPEVTKNLQIKPKGFSCTYDKYPQYRILIGQLHPPHAARLFSILSEEEKENINKVIFPIIQSILALRQQHIKNLLRETSEMIDRRDFSSLRTLLQNMGNIEISLNERERLWRLLDEKIEEPQQKYVAYNAYLSNVGLRDFIELYAQDRFKDDVIKFVQSRDFSSRRARTFHEQLHMIPFLREEIRQELSGLLSQKIMTFEKIFKSKKTILVGLIGILGGLFLAHKYYSQSFFYAQK